MNYFVAEILHNYRCVGTDKFRSTCQLVFRIVFLSQRQEYKSKVICESEESLIESSFLLEFFVFPVLSRHTIGWCQQTHDTESEEMTFISCLGYFYA